MIDNMPRLLDRYMGWLRDNTLLREVDEWVEITTPFLDRHNDCVQIYAKPSDDGFVLTDHGYTIDDLEFCGFKMKGDTRLELLNVTLNGFGIRRIGNALQVKASFEDFALQMQNLLQAMLAVNDLYYTSRSNIASAFADDVALWLKESDICFRRNVEFNGKSGLNVAYDFVIPSNGIHSNVALWSIGNPSLQSAKKTVFDWGDTEDARDGIYVPYVVLDDVNGRVSDNAKGVFVNYGMKLVYWSGRRAALKELAA
ncbi:MAG: DUF1828 domain-containing protein [Chloroflexi bacterium]|nr:DUF1828 domain-containing protein [Chloroflexota bacterium]